MHCRVEHLEEDFAELVALLNERRAPGLKMLSPDIGWHQQGPLAHSSEGTQGNSTVNRHLDKYETCGRRCFDLARIYFGSDFDVLGYPEVISA